ncbi:hypothetical protein Ppa06_09380 [Planomonospora parontospora subsp. parontospora]|uniref:Uncharacterized protein n=3 Tax=Planomonospora parontospora TaxID=58119 RepID=A0AA37BC53_9ACTN|nr:hypothetical protein GCM10010126_07230 [Planomonospora parontospora]GII07140.1 hypothetical protein Ppa06_09380 [Planomonospora parontospora subsp. parontospora]
MVRLMTRIPIPARLRRVVRNWFDSRYISRADHRRDIRDALWEVQTLGREVTALRAEADGLRREVGRLRARSAGPGIDAERAARWDDAHRLAQETAAALERVLQNEVLLWQAVDRVSGGRAAGEGSAPAGRTA